MPADFSTFEIKIFKTGVHSSLTSHSKIPWMPNSIWKRLYLVSKTQSTKVNYNLLREKPPIAFSLSECPSTPHSARILELPFLLVFLVFQAEILDSTLPPCFHLYPVKCEKFQSTESTLNLWPMQRFIMPNPPLPFLGDNPVLLLRQEEKGWSRR